MAKVELHLQGPLGERVSVHLDDIKELYPTMSKWGSRGYTSGEVPAGGHKLPLENEHDFDWALIGARKWVNPEGEEMIMHQGHAYRRREFEAVDSRKLQMPPAVKYSRGAKPTDPDHIREKGDGDIEYVTLAIFRGGKRQEIFAVKPEVR